MMEIFGNALFNSGDIGELLINFIVNLTFAILIVRYIYYKNVKDKEYFFSIMALNIAIFFICSLLSDSKIKTGFAFGLFAIFSILRYRTEVIPIRTMTFLFLAIAIAVINSMTGKKVSWGEIVLGNAAIALTAFILENYWLDHQELKQTIQYEKIENITPEKYEDLLEDLKERTGINVTRAEIKNIDFIKDSCSVEIYYKEK